MKGLLALGLALALGACGRPGWAPRASVAQRPVAAPLKAKAHAPGEIRLFLQPEAGLGPILQAIAQAKRSVWVQVYMLTEPAIVEALAQAAGRGLEVRVLLEGEPAQPGRSSTPLGTAEGVAQVLSARGVQVRFSDPRFTYTHAKAMLVDGATAYVLTFNLTKAAVAANREVGVVDQSPSDVAEFVRLFQADWDRQPFKALDEDLVVSPDNARYRLFGLMEQAKRQLFVGMEVLSDPEALALLVAKKRAGVDVRVLLGGVKKLPANRAGQLFLNQNGVPARSQAKPYLHGKYLVVDGAFAYVGSINLTANSMDLNRELGLLLQDAGAVGTLGSVFRRDWASADRDPAEAPSQPFNDQGGAFGPQPLVPIAGPPGEVPAEPAAPGPAGEEPTGEPEPEPELPLAPGPEGRRTFGR